MTFFLVSVVDRRPPTISRHPTPRHVGIVKAETEKEARDTILESLIRSEKIPRNDIVGISHPNPLGVRTKEIVFTPIKLMDEFPSPAFEIALGYGGGEKT